MCGRTSEEVRTSLDLETAREIEIGAMTARVDDSKRQFERESKAWGEAIPEEFKTVDFTFVLNNPKQFKAVQFLEDISRARKSLADSLVDAANLLRDGHDAALGIVSVPSSNDKLRELLIRRVEEFEKWSGRSLITNREGGEGLGMPKGFEGLSLKGGIRYLIDVGLLYYAIQAAILQSQKEDARSMRPTYKVELVNVKGQLTKVRLCNVCEQLVQ